MSDLLIAAGLIHVPGVGISFLWGYITYTTTLHYPMLVEHDWEKRWGARAMVFCWAWPILLTAMHAPKAAQLGRFIGSVFRDATKR